MPEVEKSEQELMLEAMKELQRQTQPWFRVVVPQLGQMAIWVERPEWETFRQYLSDLCDTSRNFLERGVYDKAGHDLSDVYRGRISVLKELIDFKTAVLNARKDLKEKEPQNGVGKQST